MPRVGPAPRGASRRSPPRTRADLVDRLTGFAVSESDPDALAGRVLGALLEATSADAALFVPARALPGRPVPAGDRSLRLDPGCRPLARAVEQNGLPLVIADLGRDHRFPDAADLRAQGCRAYYCQPLLAAGGFLGSVHLASRAPESFDSSTVEILSLAGRILALALEAYRHRKEIERRVEGRAREVTLFLELSRALGHRTRVDEIPPLLLDHLLRFGDPDLMAVLLPDGGDYRLTIQEALPLPADLRDAAAAAVRREFRSAGGSVEGGWRVHEIRAAVAAPAGALSGTFRSALHQVMGEPGRVVGMVSVFALREGAFRDGERRILSTVTGLISVTLHRLAAVRERERTQVEAVIRAMGEGLLRVDDSGRVLMVNPVGREMLEVLTGEAQPAVLTHLGDCDLAAILDELGAGRSERVHREIHEPGGRIYALTASPVRGRSGAERGVVIVLSDVTEQVHLQDKLAQTERLSALGEMISGVAHELNNPLAAVIGLAQLLDSAPLEMREQRKVRTINEEARRCQRIVQKLLSFARRQEPQRGRVDLNDVIRTVLQLREYQVRVDGIEVDLDLSPDLPAVEGDAHELQQVVLNLVNNAHHAMRGTGRPPRLEVSSRVRGDRVVVTVADNGHGIAPEHLRRIFDPFFTTKKVGEGTGLGLSLAYGSIQDHGGEIRAESRVGEGTRFTMELPALPAVPAEAAAAPRTPARTPRACRGREVLVVDDEPTIAEIIAEALSADGHRVDVVHDGEAARQRLHGQRYDLIITDLKMPRLDGRQLYDEIRRGFPDLARRVIFSTGDTVNADTVSFLERTGSPCLTKPFQLADLLDLVDRVLQPEE